MIGAFVDGLDPWSLPRPPSDGRAAVLLALHDLGIAIDACPALAALRPFAEDMTLAAFAQMERNPK